MWITAVSGQSNWERWSVRIPRPAFDGFNRVKEGEKHVMLKKKSPNGPEKYKSTLMLYLPARTAVVLKKVD